MQFPTTVLLLAALLVASIDARPQGFNLASLFGGGQQQQFGQQQQQFGQQQQQQQQFGQQQQQQRFGQFGGNDPNRFQLAPGLPSVQKNTGNAVAGGALLIPGIFAAKNILEGNNNINLRPQLGLGFNTQTGQLAPQFGVAAEIGEGDLRPTFNLGAQLDNQGIAPVVGGGVTAFNNQGQAINPGLNSGFVIRDGEAQGVIGGGVSVGSFNVGRLPFGRR